MWDLRVCAACLATGVRMYSMISYSLLQPYQLLTGTQSDDGMPHKLCWECAALVNKFNLFRNKCQRARLLLRDVYDRNEEISENLVSEIDRKEHNLSSLYSVSEVYVLQLHTSKKIFNKLLSTEKYKSVIIEDDFDSEIKEIETIKVESDFEALGEDSNCELIAKSPDENNDPEKEVLKLEVKLPRIEIVKMEENADAFESSVDDCVTFAESIEECGNVEDKKKRSTRGQKSKKKDALTKTTSQVFKPTVVVLTAEEAKQVYVQRKNSSKFKRAKFKCLLCFMTYRDNRSYEKHMLKHSPTSGKHECQTCKVRLRTRQALRVHENIQHTKKFICNLCPRVSFTRELARMHFKVHERGGYKRRRGGTGRSKKKRKARTGDEFDMVKVNLTQEQMLEVMRERQYTENYKSARYKCTRCYRGFNEGKAFSNHMRLHDPISGVFECDLCAMRCKARRTIYKHISCNHSKKYTCKNCRYVCYNRTMAKKHYRWHKGVVYTCHICGFSTEYCLTARRHETTHLSHLRTQHQAHHKHICGVCGESFVSRKGLYQHNLKMHEVKQDSTPSEAAGPYCADCDIQFSSEQAWTKHILISPKHELEKRNITNGCQYCGATFTTKAELKMHYEAEHKRFKRDYKPPQKLFPTKCAECSETLVSEGKYWIHFRQDHPGKQFPLTRSLYICEHCGKWFKNKSSLGIHAKYHLEPTYQCGKCPIKFKKLASLAAHAQSHADSGQFSCDVCSRQFALKRNLTNHFRTHTEGKPHVCEWCGKTFAYDCNLKKHELTVHCPPPVPSSSHHM